MAGKEGTAACGSARPPSRLTTTAAPLHHRASPPRPRLSTTAAPLHHHHRAPPPPDSLPSPGPRVDKRLMRKEFEYLEGLLPALALYGHVELVSEVIDQLRVS